MEDLPILNSINDTFQWKLLARRFLDYIVIEKLFFIFETYATVGVE